ncbi:MAG: hypothetical protein M3552_01360 [Planctomycetota bacterium]|nr:hypothetical protein [Planctomycetaceae bacterium]MDQ3329293.1 hypothetical protein [Planctomycetota bacterium]
MPRYAWTVLTFGLAALVTCRLIAKAEPEGAPTAAATMIETPSSIETDHAAELRVPEGFAATVFAGDDLVHDAYCLTIDGTGHVVVSGPGYIRVLVDRNGDGRADEAIPFADGPKSGAQGLCFDGLDLLAVGDGGLLRYRDADGDHRADGPPKLLLKLKTGGEHHAHAIRRGPDGCWYLLCGNDTAITAQHITAATSPVTQPTAGTLLRFRFHDMTGDVKDVAVIADGMRNAYDFDFTAAGDPVTYDSDDEREVSLPWYRPTRVFRLTPGSHAGWLSRSWKRPDLYPEMPEVLASLGRGSPTGVVVYRHHQFSSEYLNSVLVCDWTFGRVIAIPMDETDRPGEPIDFLRASGTAGFAPTDIAVGASGDVYISAGGRGTTGTVYRIQYVGERGTPVRGAEDGQGGQSVLRSNLETDPAALQESVRDKSPLTRRFALEALAEAVSLGGADRRFEALVEGLSASLVDEEPNVRKAAMHVVSKLVPAERDGLKGNLAATSQIVRYHLGRLRRNDRFDVEGLQAAADALEVADLSPDVRYDAVRLAQLSLGDVGPDEQTPDTFSGYAARADLKTRLGQIAPLRSRLASLFPTGDPVVDEEFVRLIAMLRPDDPQVVTRMLDRVTKESHPTDDLHHLFALARVPASRTARRTDATIDALLAIDAKLATRGLRQDSNWNERLGDLAAALTTVDPSMPEAMTRHSEFGRPGHVVLLKGMSADARKRAVPAFLKAADADPDYRWTAEVVAMLGESDANDARSRLRTLFDDATVRGAVLTALSRRPEQADRSKFFTGLDDANVEVVERCVAAIERFSSTSEPQELAALVAALRRLDRDAREYAVRSRIAGLLQAATGEQFGFVPGKAGFLPQRDVIGRWVEYAQAIAPDAVPAPGGDWEAIRGNLSSAEGLIGDPQRGRQLYEAKSCGRCHDGGSVGPDLAGVTGRFSREDFFLAIADPDRDVSLRYRGTLIQTRRGTIVTGLVVYESVDGVTLKDGEKTWRVESDEIEFRKPLETSLMPRGLLKDATPQGLADLEAYIASIGR